LEHLVFRIASKDDVPFIQDVYEQNMEMLHGVYRSCNDWEVLLAEGKSDYYIVCAQEPVAWFRTEIEDDTLWLGMLQVEPRLQHKGIGRAVLSYFEGLATDGISQVGIHTTDDNLPARSLYEKCGYSVTEIGPCTTADGIERVGYTYMKNV
jgi:GNAT superfamily N-acetyltransferase